MSNIDMTFNIHLALFNIYRNEHGCTLDTCGDDIRHGIRRFDMQFHPSAEPAVLWWLQSQWQLKMMRCLWGIPVCTLARSLG